MIRRAMIAIVALASAARAEPADHGKAVDLFEEGRRLMT